MYTARRNAQIAHAVGCEIALTDNAVGAHGNFRTFQMARIGQNAWRTTVRGEHIHDLRVAIVEIVREGEPVRAGELDADENLGQSGACASVTGCLAGERGVRLEAWPGCLERKRLESWPSRGRSTSTWRSFPAPTPTTASAVRARRRFSNDCMQSLQRKGGPGNVGHCRADGNVKATTPFASEWPLGLDAR